ncbi:MAG: NUDIX hydrolase [Acidobacteria bacterium]|nr:NUDIX hydrolase [Acidobacteriota bacterium]
MKESRVVFRGRVFRVRQDVVEEPALPGSRRPQLRAVREIVEHHGSVVVLPVFSDGRVLLVRQYRHAVGDFLWELVAGGIEPGENPRAAAHRELEEETGYRAGRLRRLLNFYPTPGFVSEKMILYRATDLRRGRACPEADESLETRAFTRSQLERMIRRGQLRDAKTLVGVLLGRGPGRG